MLKDRRERNTVNNIHREVEVDPVTKKQTEADVESIISSVVSPSSYLTYDGEKMTQHDYATVGEASDAAGHGKIYTTSVSDPKFAIRKKRRMAAKRISQTCLAVLCILIAGGVFALALVPQAKLSELSRDNSDLKDEIAALKKDILNAKGESEGITNMDTIRAQAMALGMQEPNANQIVNVPMSGSDRLVSVATYDSNGISDDALETARENLMAYYQKVDAAE